MNSVSNAEPAKNIGYDNSESGLSATDVQGAVDEVTERIKFIPSFVGMIVESTSLDTKVKVQNIYGADTDWIQHTGYVLRGASSGVVANSATKTGGSDDAIVVQHTHSSSGTYFVCAGQDSSSTLELAQSSSYAPKLFGGATIQTSTASVGSSGTNANIPNYKSVYIWERVS